MEVTNIHKRTINQPKDKVLKLMETLSTKEDKIWPIEKWPTMRFKDGLKVGSRGGHGIISYTIETYDSNNLIVFKFNKPDGFDGIHKFEIQEIEASITEVKHSILMRTYGLATIKWIFVIRWLHDALIEDAFDNIENVFSGNKKVSKWSIWVKLWRFILM